MKLLLDINDDKAEFVLELLSCFSYVKVKGMTTADYTIVDDLPEAAESLN